MRQQSSHCCEQVFLTPKEETLTLVSQAEVNFDLIGSSLSTGASQTFIPFSIFVSISKNIQTHCQSSRLRVGQIVFITFQIFDITH